MRFTRSFTVDAPVERVAAFHRRAESLVAITPPLVPLSGIDAPDTLGPGDRMAFTLWMGPLPVRWVAEIEPYDSLVDKGFVDVQVEGPFASWRHRHRFLADGPDRTRVHDEVTATLRRHPVWGPVGWSMFVGLPGLFAYRAWATRRALAEGPVDHDPPSPRQTLSSATSALPPASPGAVKPAAPSPAPDVPKETDP